MVAQAQASVAGAAAAHGAAPITHQLAHSHRLKRSKRSLDLAALQMPAWGGHGPAVPLAEPPLALPPHQATQPGAVAPP